MKKGPQHLHRTFILSAFSGIAAIACGSVVIKFLAAQKFTADNEMVQLIFGGDYFHPLLGAGDIAGCLVLLGIVTVISVLYPVRVARRITPLEAIARD